MRVADAAVPATPGTALRRLLRRVPRLVKRVDAHGVVGVAAVLAGVTLVAVEAPIAAAVFDIQPALAFGLALVHAGCIPLAVLRPRIAGLLGTAAVLPLQLLSSPGGHAWPWWPVLMVTHTLVLVLVGMRANWPWVFVAWAVPVFGSAAIVTGTGRQGSDQANVDVVVFAAIAGGAIIIALVVAQWGRIRAQLVRERQVSAEEHAALVLAEERARIARELHDVIAHSMSIISVQATTARFRNPQFGPAAIAEFDEIGASSRQALDEMRGLLGVLRGGERPPDLAPQPRWEDIPDLVQQAERAGVAVAFSWSDEAQPVAGIQGLAAYRIVQEALSNAIRHAPGSEVQVSCTRARGCIHLEVTNGPGSSIAAPSASGVSHGLIGMTERASSVGGTITASPLPDGGFAVRAELPARTGARSVARAWAATR